jgi:predicted  nucleic acid-binding Zn-ribbon protein
MDLSLKMLWELQELDLAIKELEDKIENSPLRGEASEAAEHLEELERSADELEKSIREQRKKLKRGELDLESITAEHSELHQRLYSGEVKNIKELEQMEIKLRSVKKKQLSLEEELLLMMESMEMRQERLDGLKVQQSASAAELIRRRQSLDGELARLGSELEQLQEERRNLAAQIEPQCLERYRALSERFQGRGVARVINDICQGCSVFISSAQRGFLYDPQAMIYCESCGRLLLRFAGEESPAEKDME